MADLLGATSLPAALAVFLSVALATLSVVLLWEGVRRYLRSRAATRALEKVASETGGRARRRTPGDEAIVAEEATLGPAWLEPVLLRVPNRDDLRRLLDQAGLRWSVASVVLTSTGLAVGLGLAARGLVGGMVLAAAVAVLGAYLPVAYIKFKRKRRFQAFEEHFPDAIDLLARAARAGHSLAVGLRVVSEEADEPVATEFRQTYEEQRFGIPMEEALLGLADRVDLVDVRIFVTSVLIQRESGGNLAENLDGLSAVIRARFRFRRDVRTKTAHGRMTGMVVAGVPFVVGVGMYALNPEYMEPLLVEPLGRMMLTVGGVLMVVGFVVIRRLVDLKY